MWLTVGSVITIRVGLFSEGVPKKYDVRRCRETISVLQYGAAIETFTIDIICATENVYAI